MEMGKKIGLVFGRSTMKICNVSHLKFMAKCSFRRKIGNENFRITALLRKLATKFGVRAIKYIGVE